MVDVLFFAELKDAIGKDKLSIDAAGLTVTEMKEKWLAAYDIPQIDRAMVAINEEYAKESTVLAEGDIVAFIPPVSGG